MPGAQGVQVGDHNRQTNIYNQQAPVAWPVTEGSPPPAAECLQPRPEEMVALEESCGPGPGTAPAAVLTSEFSPGGGSVLSGLGGVGKTQLAAAFWRGWRAGPGVRGLAVWVNATARASIVESYARAAAGVWEPGAPPLPAAEDPEGRAGWLRAWCERTDRAWLIVLDDLTDPADLHDLWPPAASTGATLVTTRRSDAALRGGGRRIIAVGLFTPRQAHTYLTSKLARPAMLAEAADLARDLQYLPLALAHAATFILDRAPGGETCATYRARLAERDRRLEELFPSAGEPVDGYQRTIATTWSLSIEVADRLSPTGLARPLLEIAALYDRNGFPLELLTTTPVRRYLASHRSGPERPDRTPSPGRRRRWWLFPRPRRAGGLAASPAGSDQTGVGEEDARGAVAVLARLSLLSVDPDAGPRAVRVHGLVQRATRDYTPHRAQSAQAAADSLLEAWTEDPHDGSVAQAYRDNTTTLAQHADEALWHLDGPQHHVLFRAGGSLGESGQVTAARDHWAHVAVSARGHLGPDHPDTLTARDYLAHWRGMAGDPGGAAAALEELLTDRLRVQGPNHPHTLTTRHNLAHWRGMAGDPGGAAAALEELLTDRLRVLGPDHPDTLTTRHNLASWRGEAGDPGGAAAALEELLTDRLRVQGPDHPDTLNTRANLARRRGETGDTAGAADAFEALLTDCLQVMGPGHPYTLTARANLANSRGQAGDPGGAAAALEELLTDMRRVLGPGHPDTLNTRHNLASWRGEAGDPGGAAAALEELLTDRLRVQGPDHPDTLTTRANLASWHGEAGDPGGAAAASEELLNEMLRVLGPDHPHTLTIRHNLAHWRHAASDGVS